MTPCEHRATNTGRLCDQPATARLTQPAAQLGTLTVEPVDIAVCPTHYDWNMHGMARNGPVTVEELR